ncbi:MAG: hypothetical protein NTV80_19100 [Verrucomicrobia bacterium]|nr:hypothetical protein [Verrucomicrobiota bacterium]
MTDLSPLGALGNRQRLDNLLEKTPGNQMEKAVLQRLAAWVAVKCVEMQFVPEPIVSVRFINVNWPTNSSELASPAERWLSILPEGKSSAKTRIIATFGIENGAAKPQVKGPLFPAIRQPPRIFTRKPEAGKVIPLINQKSRQP